MPAHIAGWSFQSCRVRCWFVVFAAIAAFAVLLYALSASDRLRQAHLQPAMRLLVDRHFPVMLASPTTTATDSAASTAPAATVKAPAAAPVIRPGIYVCSAYMGTGQIGNSVFEYIGSYVAAKRHGLTFVVRPEGGQHKAYVQISSLFKLTANVHNGPFNIDRNIGEKGWGIYTPAVVNFESYGRFTQIIGWLQSWRYLVGFESFVRQEFSLTDQYRGVVDGFFSKLGYSRAKGESKRAFVAVHIRRGDMVVLPEKYKMASQSYVIGAMMYFQNKYGSSGEGLTFIVATDDKAWTQATLDANWGNRSQVVYTGGTAEEDLAIMSSCHHAVITGGSYGWWAAWLTGGEVIYYRDFIWNGSILYSEYNADDYYPPSWIGRT